MALLIEVDPMATDRLILTRTELLKMRDALRPCRQDEADTTNARLARHLDAMLAANAEVATYRLTPML